MRQLQLGNDVITFKARFAGKVESISIPVDRVKAIFIREEGYGMRFDVEPMKKPKMSGGPTETRVCESRGLKPSILTSLYFFRPEFNTNSKKCVEFRFSVSPLSSVVEQPPCKR